MKPWAVVVLICGLALIGGGALFGWSPISRDGVTCGSAFAANTRAADVAGYEAAFGLPGNGARASDDCASARSDRAPLAIALLAAGGLAVAGAVVGSAVERDKGRATNSA